METRSAPRTLTLIWLIASQILALLSLVFWMIAAGILNMGSSAGLAPEARSMAIAIWAYPIWPVGFAVAAWFAYARRKHKLAAVLTTLTFLPVVVLILLVLSSSLWGPVGL